MIIDTSHENTMPVSKNTFLTNLTHEHQLWKENTFTENNTTTAIDVGLQLLSIGLNAIPLDQNLQASELLFKYLCTSTSLSEMNWIKIMSDFDNVGVITGKRSQNLFVVRCNTHKAFEGLEAHLGAKMDWVSKTGDYWDAWFFCAAGIVSNWQYFQGMSILGHEKVIEYPGSKSLNGITSKWVKNDFWHPHILYKEEMEEFFPDVIITPVRDMNDTLHSIEQYKQAVSVINDPEELSLIEKAYVFSETYFFGNGSSGAGKKSIYRALIERCKKESIHNFRASLRELEENSTPRKKTISKYLKEFERKGLIELISTSPMGNRYKLKTSKFYSNKNWTINGVNLTNLPAHDVWTSWSGLGSCTKNIVEFLITTDSKNVLYSAKEISNHTNVSYPTVLKRLKQLRDLELVEKNGTRWKIVLQSINQANLDAISIKLCVNGKYNTRKKQNALDRQKHSVYLVQIDKQRKRD